MRTVSYPRKHVRYEKQIKDTSNVFWIGHSGISSNLSYEGRLVKYHSILKLNVILYAKQADSRAAKGLIAVGAMTWQLSVALQ